MLYTGLEGNILNSLKFDDKNFIDFSSFNKITRHSCPHLQDGRGVRRGDHLPPHKYIKNTSTCGTTPTEHLLNTGRRPQTSQKASNSPTYLGRAKEKRKNRDKRIGAGPAEVGGAVKEERFPHTRKALRGRRVWVAEGGASEPRRRAQPQGCGGQSGEIPAQRSGADQHSPA